MRLTRNMRQRAQSFRECFGRWVDRDTSHTKHSPTGSLFRREFRAAGGTECFGWWVHRYTNYTKHSPAMSLFQRKLRTVGETVHGLCETFANGVAELTKASGRRWGGTRLMRNIRQRGRCFDECFGQRAARYTAHTTHSLAGSPFRRKLRTVGVPVHDLRETYANGVPVSTKASGDGSRKEERSDAGDRCPKWVPKPLTKQYKI